MVEKNQTTQNTRESYSGKTNGNLGDFSGVFVGGAWAFIGLLLVSIFWPNLSERTKFFTGNLWNVVIAFAVIAQVRINHRQWQIMEGQLAAMQSDLEETRTIINQNERTIKATDKNVEVAEKTSIYSQRAYVTAKIRDIGERDETLQFRLRIENSGNTPANDVVVVYSHGLREQPPHQKAPNSDVVVYDFGFTETERLGLIAPNGSYQVLSTPETSFQMGLSEDKDYKRFLSGELAYYCWGRIIYEDIFNERRRSEFCFFQSIKRPLGYPCEYGNRAD